MVFPGWLWDKNLEEVKERISRGEHLKQMEESRLRQERERRDIQMVY